MNKIDQVWLRLNEVADPVDAEAMEKYMRNHFAFLGVKTPLRRSQLKSLWQDSKKEKAIDWEFVLACYKEPYREIHYAALDYLDIMKKYLSYDDLSKLTFLATHHQWWDTIDRIDKLIGMIGLKDPRIDDLMLAWSTHEDFWLRRIAINHQRGRKEKTNVPLLETILCNNFNSDEFFINKAMGWSLREYAKTDAIWVKQFVMRYEQQLTTLTIREAMKHL